MSWSSSLNFLRGCQKTLLYHKMKLCKKHKEVLGLKKILSVKKVMKRGYCFYFSPFPVEFVCPTMSCWLQCSWFVINSLRDQRITRELWPVSYTPVSQKANCMAPQSPKKLTFGLLDNLICLCLLSASVSAS